MSTQHRGITAALIVLSTSWIAAPSAAEQSAAATAPVAPRVEIDRAAIAIDVAAQRQSLDASIRRAMSPSAARPMDVQRVAVSEARPRG
jgi:hypothetical protein